MTDESNFWKENKKKQTEHAVGFELRVNEVRCCKTVIKFYVAVYEFDT